MSNRPAPPRLPTRRHIVSASPAVSGHRPVALAMSLAACFAPLASLAQLVGVQAIHGQASVVTQGNQTTVTTQNGAGSSHSALNWQSFNIPAGTTTQFVQPSAASTSINRVLGNNPSAIFGTLSSNGKLVLVNPSGIAVGAGAVVDTAGFTASTLRMSDADALAGRLLFGDGSTAASLAVSGQIVARSGDIVLIAPDVRTSASALLDSPQGATVLAAGQKVEITGRGLEGIHLAVQAPENHAVNLGTLQGDAVGIFAGTLAHSGLVRATAVSTEGGKVVLKATDLLEVDGQVVARRGQLGGQIHATANKVRLKSGAIIDASGAQGGGEVLVGGGWQGQDGRVANAQSTVAESGVSMFADATDSGDGGTVVLWSDGSTRTAATILARGGVDSGNGGQVETSGKVWLDVQSAATVNARAATGLAGTWLLDPFEIVIASVGGPAVSPPFPGTYGGESSSQSSYIAPAIIETALNAGGNVTIKTTGPATAPAPNESQIRVAENITKSGGGASVLKLVAHGDVQVDPGITIKSTSGQLNLDFQSGYSFDSTTVSSSGGAIKLGIGATLNSLGGNISLKGSGGSAGFGVDMTDAVVDAGTGQLDIIGTSASNIGVQIVKFTGSPLITGGQVTIDGSTGTGAQGVWLDRATVNASNGLIVQSLNSRVLVGGSTLTASGGNLLVKGRGTSDGAAPTSVSLSIKDSSSVASLVQNVGAGTVTLDAELTNHSASFGSPSALLLANATVSSAGGAMSLTGVTGTAGYVEGTAGVRLDTGATVSSSGPITVTGTAGSNAYVNSRGILTNAGSTIVSSGGSVTLNGTLNNPSAANGTAVRVDGQVQANGLLLVTGAATVGGSAGTGVDLGATGQLIGGPGGLTVTGSVSSATTATNIVATTFAGSATSGGNIAINGTVSAPSAVNAKGVELAGGSVTGTGAATLTVTGSGVPAPAPASSYDVTVTGTTLGTSGGEIKLVGDRMDIASAVNSGAGRTVITPFTTSRSITLGGSSETAALNLSASEINNITSSTLVLGGSAFTGGISIGSTGGAINPTGTSALSLINNNASGPGISQSAAFTVANLNADARTVSLNNAGNQVSQVSGRAYAGVFEMKSASALQVGAVDSVTGVVGSTTGLIAIESAGALTVNQSVFSVNGPVTLKGNGITLGAGKTVSSASGSATVSLDALGTGALALANGGVAGGNVSLTNATSASLGDVTASTGLALTNISGSVGQQVATSVSAGQLSGNSLGGAVNLGNTGNQFNSVGTLASASGGITLYDSTVNLDIDGAISGGSGSVDVRTIGHLTQSQAITSSATGEAIVLAAGGNYINANGAGALTAGSGRWLVYSTSPAEHRLTVWSRAITRSTTPP
jgi:filamentous hemagglutinin family protein